MQTQDSQRAGVGWDPVGRPQAQGPADESPLPSNLLRLF